MCCVKYDDVTTLTLLICRHKNNQKQYLRIVGSVWFIYIYYNINGKSELQVRCIIIVNVLPFKFITLCWLLSTSRFNEFIRGYILWCILLKRYNTTLKYSRIVTLLLTHTLKRFCSKLIPSLKSRLLFRKIRTVFPIPYGT